MGASSSDYSEWILTKSGLLESGNLMKCWKARTGRPVGGHPFTQHTDKFVIDDDDIDSDTATESNFSVILAQGE